MCLRSYRTLIGILLGHMFVLASLHGQESPYKHVQFVDAGFKYDHIWISLRNFRDGKVVNRDVRYAIYLGTSDPTIGPRQIKETHMRRFPVIEFQIGLDELGLTATEFFGIFFGTELAFVILISDGNTVRDSVILKQVLGFAIREDTKSAPAYYHIAQPLHLIPIYYKFDDQFVLPLIGPERKTGYVIEGLFALTRSTSDRVRRHFESLDNLRNELTREERLMVIDQARYFQSGESDTATFAAGLLHILKSR